VTEGLQLGNEEIRRHVKRRSVKVASRLEDGDDAESETAKKGKKWRLVAYLLCRSSGISLVALLTRLSLVSIQGFMKGRVY
jgi:hypothetical protein